MASDPLAIVPPNFKSLQHYIKTAAEHDKRDPIVSYYCRLYAMQKGMEIDRKSPDCRSYLQALMNSLELMKKQNKDNEALQSEMVGQAHVENYALKLFLYADTEDRAGRFGKNVVKSFYTAGMLMDILTTFGELAEDIEKNRKYAKWKAAYIHSCLKSGETPHAGPMGEEGMGEEFGDELGGSSGYSGGQPSNPGANNPGNMGFSQPPGNTGFNQPPSNYNQPESNFQQPNAAGYGNPANGTQSNYQNPTAAPRQPSFTPPAPVASHQPEPVRFQQPQAPRGGVQLKPEDYTKAMKLCRFATSALQYEDAKTAIENLTKAINLLTTGRE